MEKKIFRITKFKIVVIIVAFIAMYITHQNSVGMLGVLEVRQNSILKRSINLSPNIYREDIVQA